MLATPLYSLQIAKRKKQGETKTYLHRIVLVQNAFDTFASS